MSTEGKKLVSLELQKVVKDYVSLAKLARIAGVQCDCSSGGAMVGQDGGDCRCPNGAMAGPPDEPHFITKKK